MFMLSERLNIQIDNRQTKYDSRILTHNLCSNQPRMVKLDQWLPASLFFDPASNSRQPEKDKCASQTIKQDSHF